MAGPINPLLFTVTTEIVPSHLRGRVFGAVRGGAWAAIPLGTLLGGVLVGAIGVAATFLGIGVLLAVVVAYGFVNPAFRDSRWTAQRSRDTPSRSLVEGISDQRALEALAARRGRDLEAEGVSVVPIGGAHAIGRTSSGSARQVST